MVSYFVWCDAGILFRNNRRGKSTVQRENSAKERPERLETRWDPRQEQSENIYLLIGDNQGTLDIIVDKLIDLNLFTVNKYN